MRAYGVKSETNELSELSELYALAREGSMEAFERFYERIAPFVTGIAAKLLGGDRMEAEDVCHDVLLSVLTRPDGYRPERGSVEAWIAVQTKSRCLDRLRKGKRVVLAASEESFGGKPSLAPADSGLMTDQLALARMEGEALRLALNELDATQRRTLTEVYFGSRTRKELAEAWRVPEGTVKSRVRYGLAHLQKAMARMGWSDGAKGGG